MTESNLQDLKCGLQKKADEFIENEADFPDNYLLKKTINSSSKEITLTYGGLVIKDSAINVLKAKLNKYYLSDCTLKIQQGFSYLNESNNNEQEKLLTNTISDKAVVIEKLTHQLDSIEKLNLRLKMLEKLNTHLSQNMQEPTP